ncbi:MAG TPA: radical SAM family heme chaperone HemW [Acidimicrobiia bacterium]
MGLRPDAPDLADAAAAWSAAYVHVPFCARVCPYCDFAVVAGRDNETARYIAAVEREIESEPGWDPLASVYVGGGTPSQVDPAFLGRLLTALNQRFGIEPDAELSLEANPEDWSPARAEHLRRWGFNRVSFGGQSFSGHVLLSLGRRHQPSDIRRAVLEAREAGFASINLDLIYGTPGESVDDWRRSLETAIDLDPDHVSCYALTVESGTELARSIKSGAQAPDPDRQADEYELAVEVLGNAGLTRYEVSNWARPGHAVRYNLTVWARGSYLAFGMGAHRFRNPVRSHNVRRLDTYLEVIEGNQSPVAGTETLGEWEAEVERVFLGIRRVAGVVAGRAGQALLASAEGQALREAGVVVRAGDRLVVTRPLLTDAVARALLGLPAPA